MMRALKGWSIAQLGDVEEGLRVCSDGVDAYRGLGSTARLSYVCYLLADTYRLAGRHEEALAEIEQACTQQNDITSQSERFRLKAEILLCLGKDELVEPTYMKALEIAMSQQARAWQLRTATGLAKLMRDQARTKEAKQLLDPIYRGFTEGFDTRDLQRAKTMLAELAA